MLFSEIYVRLVMLFLLLVLASLLLAWVIWTNSNERVPGGVLVQVDGRLQPSLDDLQHPYYFIPIKGVLV